MNFFKNYILILYLNIALTQLVQYSEPLSKIHTTKINFTKIKEIINKEIDLECISTNNNKGICQIGIEFDQIDLYRLELSITKDINDSKLFIINNNNKNIFIGPYTNLDNKIITNPLNTNSLIIEINNQKPINNISLKISDISVPKRTFEKKQTNFYNSSDLRDEPVILLTGYWPPTNEMIRHFSQNEELNPNGWQGDNWENRGYDIISYFPEFSNPDCSSCGQGFGDLEVDYQDTSEDFWPIFNEYRPIAAITFSRGYMDQSWELEYNAYNRTNWYNDFTSPFQPTPNPPDSAEPSFFLRNSNLPMENIVNEVSNLNLGINSYIDINGDPGQYVSEFMAYHGTWYRDLNQIGEEKCISAGHIHVGGYLSWENAIIATEASVRALITYIDSFIYTLGDLNQDNIIDILDLVTIVNFILGEINFTDIQMYAGDINEDSIINIQDIIIIINMILNN
tara:strand:- start:27633 stop:28994 length:1362 start_codon:yes stop_codon:yes gene_type:complete